MLLKLGHCTSIRSSKPLVQIDRAHAWHTRHTRRKPVVVKALPEIEAVSAVHSSVNIATHVAVNIAEFGLQLVVAGAVFQFFVGGGLNKLKASLGGDKNVRVLYPKDDSEDSDKESLTNDTRISDVAGIDRAKREVMEIVDFLKFPENYVKLGAKMPRGILLSGPPGCGKTLLARAIAGEAGVPLILASGSEFVEMFVGVGAQRVRGIFAQARKIAPCIIFIDEIDSVGRQRGMAGTSSQAEQDQTMNQLLTEMDGFIKSSGILVIAATNRPDILDEALVRPGRFDRHVAISLPGLQGREDILSVHTNGKPLSSDVSLKSLARVTKGFSGAELENLCNEAAICAARLRLESITRSCFEDALDKELLGLETDVVYTEEQKRVIAVHEAGHALLGILSSSFDVVRKISIVPRGDTGGVTLFEPFGEEASGLYTQEYLENQLIVTLGGRVAEELVFGRMKTTTGAYGDLQEVERIARAMVAGYGFNENLGPIAWSDGAKASELDDELQFLVENAYSKAKEMMSANEGYLLALANALMEKGELDEEGVRTALVGIGVGVASFATPSVTRLR